MGLMDSIGRGLSAAGYAGADLYAKGALADQQAAIQLERDKRLEEAGIRAEGRGLENRAAERKAVFGETVENAPALRNIKTEDYKATKKAEYDPEIQALANKAKTETLTAEEQTKLDFYNNNKTGLINQKREMARAGHIDDGAGLRSVQIEAAKLTLDEKKQVNALIREAETTTDPVRKAQIMQSLTNRGVIKGGEYDTEKVITEKTNPDGTTSKTERTQKRKPDGAKSDAVVPDGPWAKYGGGNNAKAEKPQKENARLTSEPAKAEDRVTNFTADAYKKVRESKNDAINSISKIEADIELRSQQEAQNMGIKSEGERIRLADKLADKYKSSSAELASAKKSLSKIIDIEKQYYSPR
jgi:hypothetical protein